MNENERIEQRKYDIPKAKRYAMLTAKDRV